MLKLFGVIGLTLLATPVLAQQPQYNPRATAYDACKDVTTLAELLVGMQEQMNGKQAQLDKLIKERDDLKAKLEAEKK